MLGIICIFAWTAGLSFVFLLPFKLANKLRVDLKEEFVGCDLTKHGQYAFILDVDKVRGIDEQENAEVIAEKVRNASRATHEIIKVVLAKRSMDKKVLGPKESFDNDKKKDGKYKSINEEPLLQEVIEDEHDR